MTAQLPATVNANARSTKAERRSALWINPAIYPHCRERVWNVGGRGASMRGNLPLRMTVATPAQPGLHRAPIALWAINLAARVARGGLAACEKDSGQRGQHPDQPHSPRSPHLRQILPRGAALT